MHDFGRVARERPTARTVLLFDYLEYLRELRNGLFRCRHQCVASRDRRDFGHPAVRLVAINDELVVVEADGTIVVLSHWYSNQRTPCASEGGWSKKRKPVNCGRL